LAIFTLLTALCISVVAAWYSIIGLVAIFPSATVITGYITLNLIIILGIVLEVGKLVTASWLYQNWRTSPKLLRGYLTTAVVVIMFITSMGIYGFLSKAHIDQMLVAGDNSIQIEAINQKINQQQRKIDDSRKVIAQLDSAVETLTKYDRIRGKDGAIAVREKQSAERAYLSKIIDTASAQITSYRIEKQSLSKDKLRLEAEVGPIKYIAELFDIEGSLDAAVRGVILTIVFVFDPLAVLLIIAANISLRKPKRIQNVVRVKKNEWVDDVAEIDDTPEPELEPEEEFNVISEFDFNPAYSSTVTEKNVAEKTKEEIRREQNEKAFKDNGTYGPTNKHSSR
jgi:hypothetical protein